jgi:hypothetical protein
MAHKCYSKKSNVGRLAQVVKLLPNKHEILSSNPSNAKKEKKRKTNLSQNSCSIITFEERMNELMKCVSIQEATLCLFLFYETERDKFILQLHTGKRLRF